MLECVRLALRGGDTAPAYEQPQFDGCIRTMTHRRTDASVECGCIRCLAPAHTARRLATSPLRSEGAGRDQQEDGVGRRSGRVEEGRTGAGSRARETARLRRLSCSALRPCSSCARRASVLVAVEVRARGEGRGRTERERAGTGSRARETARTHRLSCSCSPPPSSVDATSLRARRCGVPRAPPWSVAVDELGRRGGRGGRGQERAAGPERQRGRTVSRAPAARLRPPWPRRASGLVAVDDRACGEGPGGGRGRRARRSKGRGQGLAAEHERQRGRTVARASAARLRPPWTRRASGLVAVDVRGRGHRRWPSTWSAGAAVESKRAGAGRRARATARTHRRSCCCCPLPSSVAATSLRARRCSGSRARASSVAVDGVGGRGGREEEGRSGQQSTNDNADASSVVPCSPLPSDATSLRARRC